MAKQYPDIHLAPGYYWNAGSAGENDWQLGATVELPLLNHHRGPIAEAAARREASAARFLALQAKVITEIDGAVASFRASQTNVAALEALAAAQEKQQQTVEAQFQAGAVDRLDVLTAELESNATSIARLDAQVKLQQAVGALEDAVQRPLDLPESVWQTEPRASPTKQVERSPMKRIVVIIICLAAVAGLAWLVWFKPAKSEEAEKKPETEVPVQVGKLKQVTLHGYVTAYGTVEPEPAGERPAASARVVAAVAGVVTEVKCVEGQRVEKGAVLFQLDPRAADVAVDFAEKTLERAAEAGPDRRAPRKRPCRTPSNNCPPRARSGRCCKSRRR